MHPPTARRGLLGCPPSLPLFFPFCFSFRLFIGRSVRRSHQAVPNVLSVSFRLPFFSFIFVVAVVVQVASGKTGYMRSHLCLWSSYLIVTVFHGHLSLAAPPTPRSPSSEEPSSSSSTSASVVWSSPASGDRFGPGDAITGEWQTTQNVVSPSFKLCAGGEDGCGATVWPEVVESAGYYHVSLCVRLVPFPLLAPSYPRFFSQ